MNIFSFLSYMSRLLLFYFLTEISCLFTRNRTDVISLFYIYGYSRQHGYMASNDWLIVQHELWKEAVVAYFRILLLILQEWTKDLPRIAAAEIRKRAPSEHKSEALPTEPVCPVITVMMKKQRVYFPTLFRHDNELQVEGGLKGKRGIQIGKKVPQSPSVM